MTDKDKNKNGDENMESFTFRMQPSLLKKARDKADLIPLSAIIRRLLEKWLNGEISID